MLRGRIWIAAVCLAAALPNVAAQARPCGTAPRWKRIGSSPDELDLDAYGQLFHHVEHIGEKLRGHKAFKEFAELSARAKEQDVLRFGQNGNQEILLLKEDQDAGHLNEMHVLRQGNETHLSVMAKGPGGPYKKVTLTVTHDKKGDLVHVDHQISKARLSRDSVDLLGLVLPDLPQFLERYRDLLEGP